MIDPEGTTGRRAVDAEASAVGLHASEDTLAPVPVQAPGARRPEMGRRFVGPFTRRQAAAVVVVVATVALLLVAVTRPLTGQTAVAPQGNGPGASFYRVGEQTQGLRIGDLAPELAAADGTNGLTDLAGQPVTLASLKGRPVWVIFWATWCPPCQTETPDIQRTWEAYRSAGLAVVAIDIQEPAEPVADYARTYGLTYTIGLDATASIMKTYAVFGLPTHYFIDREGVVRDRYFGPLTGAQMRERIGPIVGKGS